MITSLFLDAHKLNVDLKENKELSFIFTLMPERGERKNHKSRNGAQEVKKVGNWSPGGQAHVPLENYADLEKGSGLLQKVEQRLSCLSIP